MYAVKPVVPAGEHKVANAVSDGAENNESDKSVNANKGASLTILLLDFSIRKEGLDRALLWLYLNHVKG